MHYRQILIILIQLDEFSQILFYVSRPIKLTECYIMLHITYSPYPLTRMHSSMMRTVRCSSRLLGGRGLSAQGVSAQGPLQKKVTS